MLAATARLIITIGAVASAITAILDLGDRLATRNQGNVSGSKTEMPVQEGVQGVRVIEVIPGSPADHTGVRVQDIITDVSGKSVEDVDDFRKTPKQARPGDSLLLSVARDSHRKYVLVKLQRIEGSDLLLGLRVEDAMPPQPLFARAKTRLLQLLAWLAVPLLAVVLIGRAVFVYRRKSQEGHGEENSSP